MMKKVNKTENFVPATRKDTLDIVLVLLGFGLLFLGFTWMGSAEFDYLWYQVLLIVLSPLLLCSTLFAIIIGHAYLKSILSDRGRYWLDVVDIVLFLVIALGSMVFIFALISVMG